MRRLPHEQNTDTKLAEGTGEEVSAAQAGAAHTHAQGDGSDHADVMANTLGIGRVAKPAGMVRMVSITESGNIGGSARSTTGYIGIRWWDGTVEIVGDGVVDNNQSWSKAVPSWSSAWSGHAPKEIFMWSATGAADPTQSGDLYYLYCPDNSLVSLDVSDLAAMALIYCDNNLLTSLDVSGLASLGKLYCQGNSLVTLDVSGLASFDRLMCQNNSLVSIRATDVVLSYYEGSDISGNDLDADALDRFYTDLGEDTSDSGIVDVTGNPGTSGDDPGIATAKGYTIVGS